MKETPELAISPTPEEKVITKERLLDMMSLEIEARADFSQTLEGIKNITGADLAPREGGYHLTVIGPTEMKTLAALDESHIAELEEINTEIRSGQGITITGVGFIDGSDEAYSMREVDKVKKTAFITLDIPKLQAFRQNVGLPPKDFHLTLGFEGGDVHMQIIGQEQIKPGSPKMKDVTGPIPKKPDPRFSSIKIPMIEFGELDGPRKERK